MLRWFLILLIIPSIELLAQTADLVKVENTGLHNFTLIYSNNYDGNSLWGYMDGGADLYLEYGFVSLLVEEIKYKDKTIKCEIFKMKDAESAFGIFSIQRHNCRINPELKTNHCINNYQVQLAIGNYYISLVNQTGDINVQEVALEIASKFSDSIEEVNIKIPDLELFKEQRQKLILMKGNIALGNVYPQALDYMENTSGYTMWLLPPSNNKDPFISVITFENAEEILKYAEIAFPGVTLGTSASVKLKKGGYRRAKKIENNRILQVEGKTPKKIKKMF